MGGNRARGLALSALSLELPGRGAARRARHSGQLQDGTALGGGVWFALCRQATQGSSPGPLCNPPPGLHGESGHCHVVSTSSGGFPDAKTWPMIMTAVLVPGKALHRQDCFVDLFLEKAEVGIGGVDVLVTQRFLRLGDIAAELLVHHIGECFPHGVRTEPA